MPRDDATSTYKPRALVACLILSAPLLLSGFVALIWTLLYALLSTPSKPRPEVPTFCCPEVIETIIVLSNVTVDPCRNIMSYACYKKSELDRQAIVERALASAVFHPTLQGKLRTPVSDILRTHHESCLVSAVSNMFTAEYAVKAVIDLFRRWTGTSTSSPHAPVDLIKLVGLLHFRYRIFSVFRIWTVRLHGRKETADAIAALSAPYILTADGTSAMKYADAMFEAANSYTGLNVTRTALTKLTDRLQNARKVFDELVYIGRVVDLDYLFPYADMSSWKVILRTVPLIGVEDPPNVQGIVEVLIDKWASVQAAALVYFSVHTAHTAFFEEIRNTEQAASPVVQAAFCNDRVVKLFPLWDVLSTQQMTSPDRDAVVMQLFDRVADAVVADAQVSLSAHLNSSEVRTVLRGVSAVLAVDVTAPYAHHLPYVSDDYFENVMELRDFHFQVRRINDARGLPGLHRFRQTLFEAFVSRVGNHVVISAGVYPLLNFNDSHVRSNRTRLSGAAVNNAAVLGVLLADALWDALIGSERWDLDTREQLKEHAFCIRESAGFILYPALKHPLLSLQSAARAIATPGWNQRVLAFGPYSFSASQIFFMLFVLHHPCQRLDVNDDDVARDVSLFVGFVEEFRDAFGCATRPKVNWTAVCQEPQER
ncbi:hypothetical protein HPB50_018044 [Hyalomma asiaticum]|uniref:Uncharacterized protein n=1 Tax=Hyalomma asiaticum TaxID=266040 RepID=A0ACB7SA19_HYAAI|nr:hypothetical protein HPB50_018044 [Hyalomma asiaticum]